MEGSVKLQIYKGVTLLQTFVTNSCYKPLDSGHVWDQVNMSVIDKCWLYIAGHILEI